MDFTLIIAGMVIGLTMAAPIGPVNLVVIRTALNCGFSAALLAGFGAVIADVLMAGVAAYGIRSVEHFFLDYENFLQIAGGLLLVVIGISTARTHFAAADLIPIPHTARLGLTFMLSVTNPALILGFFAIVSSMSGILSLGSASHRPVNMLLGVTLGGTLWWLLLSLFVSRLKAKLSAASLDRLNRWSGIFVAAFGFVLLLKSFD